MKIKFSSAIVLVSATTVFSVVVMLSLIVLNMTESEASNYDKYILEYNSAKEEGVTAYANLSRDDVADFVEAVFGKDVPENYNRSYRWVSDIRVSLYGATFISDRVGLVDLVMNSVFNLFGRYLDIVQAGSEDSLKEKSNYVIVFSDDIYSAATGKYFDIFSTFIPNRDETMVRKYIDYHRNSESKCMPRTVCTTDTKKIVKAIIFVDSTLDDLDRSNWLSHHITKTFGFFGESSSEAATLNSQNVFPYLRKTDIYYLSLLYSEHFQNGMDRESFRKSVSNALNQFREALIY